MQAQFVQWDIAVKTVTAGQRGQQRELVRRCIFCLADPLLPGTAAMYASFQFQCHNEIANWITESMHYHNFYMQTKILGNYGNLSIDYWVKDEFERATWSMLLTSAASSLRKWTKCVVIYTGRSSASFLWGEVGCWALFIWDGYRWWRHQCRATTSR